jgi:cytidylate kinase
MSKNIVVAIDGPAGAGKSTVAKAVAKERGLRYLDTGAMYRALALAADRAGVPPGDSQAAEKVLMSLQIAFAPGDPQRVLLNGEDVTDLIRTPDIGELASALSAHSPVRREMVRRQQKMVSEGGVVLEGRDATTVIAPDADVKIYLTASLEERARRRRVEFEEKGVTADFDRVRSEMELRDHRDITREDSPLRVAPDAVVVDSANLSVAQVVQKVLALIP